MQTFAKMIEIKESDADILQLRYLDVLFDGKMTQYEAVFGHWLYSKVCISEAQQFISKNSLFAGLGNHNERDGSMSLEALWGAFMYWNKELSRLVDEIYTRIFGDALNGLEYEKITFGYRTRPWIQYHLIYKRWMKNIRPIFSKQRNR